MAKVRDDAITVADIEEYLSTQDDFALELFVYHAARTAGLNVTHGGTYEDPLTKKPRQYDIRAWAENNYRRIDLAIECKSLRTSFPLLISRIARVKEEAFHQVIYSFKRQRNSILPDFNEPPANALTMKGENSIYPVAGYVGKSTSQIGRNDKGELLSGDAQVFEKWSQALASADELIADAVYHYRKSDRGLLLTAVIPVLVVSDNTLWVADYSDDGELQGSPRQVSDALLYVGREYSRPLGITFTATHLHICTKSHVHSLLDDLAGGGAIWDALFSKEGFADASAET
jgi:hypothetical protein